MKHVRLTLILLALSISLASISFSLVEPIGETVQTSSTFTIASGDELGITLNATTYDEEIVLPGQEISIPVVVSSTTGIPAYLFAEISIPPEFTMRTDDVAGISSS